VAEGRLRAKTFLEIVEETRVELDKEGSTKSRRRLRIISETERQVTEQASRGKVSNRLLTESVLVVLKVLAEHLLERLVK
jgi:hypothetical protein